MSKETDYVISVRNLSKTFGKFMAVDNLSLNIKKGAIFGLIGPNGSGKTTTISMLLDELDADPGANITILGYEIPKNIKKIYPDVGYMPQDLALYMDLSVEKNLKFFGDLYRIPKKELKIRIDEMLDLVGLTEFRKRLLSKCSGGMQRRASLAIALIHKPKILILDEPTVGVDPELRIEFWNYFKKISREDGVSILITTHYLAESLNCDSICLMNKSDLVLGTPNELRETVKKEKNLPELPDMEQVFIYFTNKYSILHQNMKIGGND